MANKSDNSAQVVPLAVASSGGAGAKMLNDQNTLLTMAQAQIGADSLYDPPPPPPPTKAKIIENFITESSTSIIRSLAVAGLLMIVYGLVSRKR